MRHSIGVRTVFALVAGLVLAAAVPAQAQLFDTQCLTDFNCNAGDVGLHQLLVVQTIDDCAGPGDTATVVFRVYVHNSVGGSSYDIGIFLGTNGIDVTAAGAVCHHIYLPPNFTTTPVYGDIDSDGVLDVFRPLGASDPPFWEVDDDCGDLEAGTEGVIEFGPVTVQCVDTDQDGNVDLSLGISNKANSGNDCAGVAAALPDPASKCTAGRVDFLNLPIPVELQSFAIE